MKEEDKGTNSEEEVSDWDDDPNILEDEPIHTFLSRPKGFMRSPICVSHSLEERTSISDKESRQS